MVDIIYGDRNKKLFQFARSYFYKKYMDDIVNFDVSDFENEGLVKIHDIIFYLSMHVGTGHHRNLIDDFTEIFFWAITKKNILQEQSIYILYYLSNNEIKNKLEPYVVQPKNWKTHIIRDAIIRKFASYLCLKMFEDFGANPINVHEDLTLCGNASIKYVFDVLNDVLSDDKYIHYRQIIEFILWTAYKDTAYRDVLMCIFNEIGNDDLIQLSKQYVKPFNKWSMNAWIASIKTTREQRKNNEIPSHIVSYPEQINVPHIERKRLEKITGGDGR